jgi:hypothetical protein
VCAIEAQFCAPIDTGKLRDEIPSAKQREHVLPLYMELAAFESHFGLPATDKPRFIIMNKSGRVSKAECLGEAC